MRTALLNFALDMDNEVQSLGQIAAQESGYNVMPQMPQQPVGVQPNDPAQFSLMQQPAVPPQQQPVSPPQGRQPYSPPPPAYFPQGTQQGGDPTLSLLREFEGFRDTPYWDVNAHRTGYGSDTVTMADGSVIPVRPGMRITREDAERDLDRRVRTEFVPKVVSAVGSDRWEQLNPNQRAALTSIAYNYGNLPQSVASAVRSGDTEAAANAINALGSHNRGVNASRRAREAAIFGGQSYTPSQRTMSARGGAFDNGFPSGGETPEPTMADVVDEEAEKRYKEGVFLMELGKGISALSRGETVDMSGMFDKLAARQREATQRLKELRDARTRQIERREDRGYAVEDRDLGFQHDESMLESRQQHEVGMQDTRLGHETTEREGAQEFTLLRDELGRDFTTSERESTQAFNSDQSQLDRLNQWARDKDSQAWQTQRDEFDRIYQDGQRRAQEAFQRGERIDSQQFSQARTAEEHAFQLGLQGKRQEFELGMKHYDNMFEQYTEDRRAGYAVDLYGDLVPNADVYYRAGGMDAVNDAVTRAETKQQRTEVMEGVRGLAESTGDPIYEQVADIMDATNSSDFMGILKELNVDDPALVKEFEFMETLEPNEQAAFLALKRSGAVNMGETADVALLKHDIERMAAFRTKVDDMSGAYQAFQTLQQLNEMAPGGYIDTGMVQNMTLPVRRVLDGLGLLSDDESRQVTLQQAMQQVAFSLVPSVREPGQTSNFELQMYLQANPGVANTPEAVAMTTQLMMNRYRYMEDRANMMRDYLEDNGNLNGFDNYLREQGEAGNLQQDFYQVSNRTAALNAIDNGRLKAGDFMLRDNNGEQELIVLTPAIIDGFRRMQQ